MPFTPKFVDMVRSLTTSSGTGAISVGSPVPGFTGIGAALTVGEQFYYCMQGIDKPAERETGRGTLRSDGRIDREAISGTLTNFTAGTKTIALVTAAEWFAKIEQGGGNGNGGGAAVATIAELAALDTTDGATAVLTAKGREGLFVFDAGNHSALVAADTRKGIYVAPAAASSGANGVWVRRFDGPIEVRWFGTAGDFVTDDLPAFDGALAVIKARINGSYHGGGSLHVAAGRYFLGGTLNIHVPVHLIGDGSAQGFGGTLLRFPNDTTGVVFNYGSTHGEGTGSQGDSSGSRMEGFQLWGGNVNVDGAGVRTTSSAGDSLTGHGVRIRTTFITLRDIFVAFFGGDGFHINASNGGAAGVTGNANNFRIDDCQSIYNRGYAYLTNGLDANSGTFVNCSAISCSGGGFIEYSFLGNSYVGLHVRDCGVNCAIVAPDSPTGTCTHAGNVYRVMPGQEVAASTTVPGTNAAVWAPAGNAFANRPWAAGKTWAIGAPFATNPANVNGQNVVVGLYTEDQLMPVAATQPSLLIGGLHGNNGFVGSGTDIVGGGEGRIGAGGLAVRKDDHSIKYGNPDADILVEHQRGPGGAINVKTRGGTAYSGKHSLDLFVNNSFVAQMVGLEPTHPHGYGSTAIARLFVGDGSVFNAIRVGAVNAIADLNGQAVGAGAIFFDMSPAAGAASGWVCTSGGTVGSGAVFADLPPVGLVEASAADVRAGASAGKFVSPAKLFEAAAPVALTDATTVTIDGASGINFNLTLGGNRTLANPVNMRPGQSGRIRVKQDATGGRTLAFGANWLFAGGDPTLSSAANAIDVIAYFANASNEIEATIVKALA